MAILGLTQTDQMPTHATQRRVYDMGLRGEADAHMRHVRLIVPTLRVGMHVVTLCATALAGAERLNLHAHAERGNDHQ